MAIDYGVFIHELQGMEIITLVITELSCVYKNKMEVWVYKVEKYFHPDLPKCHRKSKGMI